MVKISSLAFSTDMPGRRLLGISLSPADYAAFAALAAADNRKPGALARIVVLAYLNSRRPAPAPPAPPAAAPAAEKGTPHE